MKTNYNIFKAIAIILMVINGLCIAYLFGYYRGQKFKIPKDNEIMQVDSMHSDIEKEISNDTCIYHFYEFIPNDNLK